MTDISVLFAFNPFLNTLCSKATELNVVRLFCIFIHYYNDKTLRFCELIKNQ